ncbi:MucBP domain-containing protein [Levilactobacillus zymae]|uniref:MucBP domain-containing protein n=1 Tax=Levilactobacillus zymae TaxID=267363 RepID=UPI0028B62CCF|nr:MucBP domain-containing protein [Levilactobacillus zymae]MDT6979482.1 MucBP domain-containing protein [Levilactobacillus zymae]
MQTKRTNGNQWQSSRWLFTSAVALTLGTVGLTVSDAHADATLTTGQKIVSQATREDQLSKQHAQLPTADPAPTPAAEKTTVKSTYNPDKDELNSVPQSPADDVAVPAQSREPAGVGAVTASQNKPEPPVANQPTPVQDRDHPEGVGDPAPVAGDRDGAPDTSEQAAPTTGANTVSMPQPSRPTVPQPSGPSAPKPAILAAPRQTVDDLIPDKNLQQLVLYALQQQNFNITNVAQITPELLQKLTVLDVDDGQADKKQNQDRAFYNAIVNVKSLAGLYQATGLQKLIIRVDSDAAKKWGKRAEQLQNIAALAQLTHLTTISLDGAQIGDEDVQALSQLHQLTTLTLNWSRVTDLAFLANLTALTDIGFNKLADSAYKIKSLAPLKKLVNLSIIGLANNDISDITVLRNITAIPSNFGLSGNHIFDITPALSLKWRPFIGGEPYYNISANNQTWSSPQVVLNPETQHLDTWSFAYDNLYNFNEFMSSGKLGISLNDLPTAQTIGASNWIQWSQFKANTGNLYLNWDVSRHNDSWQPVAPDGLNFSGTMTIPYTLKANVGAVTVNYRLDGGVNIAPFTILSGPTASSLDVLTDATVKQAIANLEDRGFAYEKPADHQQVTGTTVTYNQDAQRLTLLFTPLQRVYLVDENGQALVDQHQQPLMIKAAGKTGTAWHATLPTIAGYDPDRVTGGQATLTAKTLSGTIQDVNSDLYVFYKPNGQPVTPPVKPVDPAVPGNPVPPVSPVVPVVPVATGTVTVHYQTKTGEQLAANTTLTGTVGATYTTTPKTLTGYQLVATPTNATGVYTNQHQDVAYTYRAVLVIGSADAKGNSRQPSRTPRGPRKTTTPWLVTTNGTPGKWSPKAPVHGISTTPNKQNVRSQAAQTTPRLPQTNEQRFSSGWGVAVLAVLGSILGVWRWRRF